MKCGLLGKKLSHSYSPQIHRYLGEYEYSLNEVQPEKLEDFFKNMVKSADGVIVSGVKVRHYLVNRGTALRIYFFYEGDTLRFSDV